MAHVLWLALFFGCLAQGPSMMNIDGDLGRHITIGRYILDTHSIPTVDIFSNSMAGQPLTPHEWLAQVIFALADRWMGLDGVVLVTGLVIATAFTLVFRQALKCSNSVLAGLLITVLAAGAASLHWLTRPHIFTFLLMAIWISLMEDVRQGKRNRWMWLPVVMWVWANTHGAFIAGFVVWGIYLAAWGWQTWIERMGEDFSSDFVKAALWGGGLSLAISFINPSGINLWATSLGYLQNTYLVGHTAEYLSPDFHNRSTWLFLLLIAATVFFFSQTSSPRKILAVLLAGAWMVMGLVSARNIPLFTIVAAPLLAAACADWMRERAGGGAAALKLQGVDQRLLDIETSLRGWVWPAVGFLTAVILLGAGVRLDSRRQGNQFDAQVFPVAAVHWLGENPQSGSMFNYFPWGGYLLYCDWPATRVFIDGQTDFYGEALTRKYETVLTQAEGWQAVLAEYQIDWVIFPSGSALIGALNNDLGWLVIYQDDTAVIMRRNSGGDS